MEAQKRFLGCLLGGAAGDALGAPVEFMTRSQIRERFGAAGIRRFAAAYGRVGAITDDTQMTLFTAEGLLRAWIRGCSKGITTYAGVTQRAYRRWLYTQGEAPVEGDSSPRPDGWLVSVSALHHRRAPGNTCLAALRAGANGETRAANDSKGCGGIMRVAPVGLFVWRLGRPTGAAFELAAELAAITHGHPTGYLAAGAFAEVVHELLRGVSLTGALTTAKQCLRAKAGHEETLRAIEGAEELATLGLGHDEAITRLGQGWVAEEALAVALYCALVAPSLEEGVVLAANHDGDSDSTASMAGNLLGTVYGIDAIPERWLDELELREVIAEVAEDLYSFPDWPVGEFSPDSELGREIWRKYPGY